MNKKMRSELMKRAWAIVKSEGTSISDALKKVWQLIKSQIQEIAFLEEKERKLKLELKNLQEQGRKLLQEAAEKFFASDDGDGANETEYLLLKEDGVVVKLNSLHPPQAVTFCDHSQMKRIEDFIQWMKERIVNPKEKVILRGNISDPLVFYEVVNMLKKKFVFKHLVRGQRVDILTTNDQVFQLASELAGYIKYSDEYLDVNIKDDFIKKYLSFWPGGSAQLPTNRGDLGPIGVTSLLSY